jgi:hypothetical protein
MSNHAVGVLAHAPGNPIRLYHAPCKGCVVSETAVSVHFRTDFSDPSYYKYSSNKFPQEN